MPNRDFLSRDQWVKWIEDQGADTKAAPALRKRFAVDIVERELDPATGMSDIEFVLSTAAVDRERDVIDVAGWQVDDFKRNPVVLWAHQYDQPPVGKALEVWSDDNSLRGKVRFTPRDVNPFGHMVYQMLQGGFLNAVSVGFQPKEYVYNEEHGGYDFNVQDLLEFSVVPVPANPEALIAASMKGDIDLEPLRSWAKDFVNDTEDGSADAESAPAVSPAELDELCKALTGSSVAATQDGTGTMDPPGVMYCSVSPDCSSANDPAGSTWTYTTGNGTTYVSPTVTWYDSAGTQIPDPGGKQWTSPDYEIDWTQFGVTLGVQPDNETEEMMEKSIKALAEVVESLKGIVESLPGAIEEAVARATAPTVDGPDPDPTGEELSDDEVRQIIADTVKESMTSVTGRLPD